MEKNKEPNLVSEYVVVEEEDVDKDDEKVRESLPQ